MRSLYPYAGIGKYQPGKYQDLVVGIYNNMTISGTVLIKGLKGYM